MHLLSVSQPLSLLSICTMCAFYFSDEVINTEWLYVVSFVTVCSVFPSSCIASLDSFNLPPLGGSRNQNVADTQQLQPNCVGLTPNYDHLPVVTVTDSWDTKSLHTIWICSLHIKKDVQLLIYTSENCSPIRNVVAREYMYLFITYYLLLTCPIRWLYLNVTLTILQ